MAIKQLTPNELYKKWNRLTMPGMKPTAKSSRSRNYRRPRLTAENRRRPILMSQHILYCVDRAGPSLELTKRSAAEWASER